MDIKKVKSLGLGAALRGGRAGEGPSLVGISLHEHILVFEQFLPQRQNRGEFPPFVWKQAEFS